MSELRVLVVDDSPTVRARVRQALERDPELRVAGEAEDGKRAIELCRELRPHAITLDMVLPVMSGLRATEYIMAHHPTPILIVSSSMNRGDLFNTYDALAAGALDVLEKPRLDDAEGEWEKRLVRAVKRVSRIRVITHPRARLSHFARTAEPLAQLVPPAPPPAPLACAGPGATGVLAIGTSTGGPAALVQVLGALPNPPPVPVLFVLHIDEPFGAAFADWLQGQTGQRIGYARSGEPLAALRGRVAMAPPGQHLAVRGGALQLLGAPERHGCRPSVDVLFESLAQDCGPATLACLMTGMGRDGASGLLAIRRAGGRTIAQDEASSVVYGMPREAAALGAAERVLPLEAIGPALAHELTRGARALP